MSDSNPVSPEKTVLQMQQVIAIAHKNGWNGVTNSKSLFVFLDRGLEMGAEAEAKVDALEHQLAELQRATRRLVEDGPLADALMGSALLQGKALEDWQNARNQFPDLAILSTTAHNPLGEESLEIDPELDVKIQAVKAPGLRR